MKLRWGKWLVTAAVATTLAGVAGTAQSTPQRDAVAAKHAFKIGIIYSRTGALARFGAQYVQGFRLGIQYATNGTNKVNGHSLDIAFVDDATDPAKAVAAGKELIGRGYKVLAGSTSSGVALQMAQLADQNKILFISGAAASDALTGINRYTFRSGRQSYQDVLTAASFIPPRTAGRKITVFAEDTAFGNANVAAVIAVFGGKGHTVTKILVPFGATDLTPFARQLQNANADLAFVAWAGPNAPQMWQALQQQGVPRSTKIVTGLAERATYQTFGPLAQGLDLLSHYVHEGPKNKVNDWLKNTMRRRGQVPDIFTPDGFNAALMLVRAIKQVGTDDVGRMIRALDGYQFVGPKGVMRIRPQDHALLQPMFQVRLVRGNNGRYAPRVLKVVSPGNVQPPVTPFKTSG